MDIITKYQIENYGNSPSEKYIAKLLGVGEKTYQMIKDALSVYHIDTINRDKYSENNEEDDIEKMPDETDDYMNIIIRDNRETFVRLILRLRKDVERKVIIEHFYKNRKLKDIADELEITEQRINKIKKNALGHLREMPEVINIARETGILRTKRKSTGRRKYYDWKKREFKKI